MTNYRIDIDWLRAVAVIAVIAFHAGLPVTGGFIGVDIFFVISGYLITKIIIKEINANEFNLTNFYERRIRRILPALFAVITSALLFGYFIFDPVSFRSLSSSTIAILVAASNFYFMKHVGYFDGPSENMPLLHTWSLSVEEQFYFVIPLIIIIFARLKLTNIKNLMFFIMVISFILSLIDQNTNTRFFSINFVFYLVLY